MDLPKNTENPDSQHANQDTNPQDIIPPSSTSTIPSLPAVPSIEPIETSKGGEGGDIKITNDILPAAVSNNNQESVYPAILSKSSHPSTGRCSAVRADKQGAIETHAPGPNKKTENLFDTKSIVIESPKNPASASSAPAVDIEKSPRADANAETHEVANISALDKAKPLAADSFPDRTREGNLVATLANLKHLLKSYGIKVRYNTIKKKLTIIVPGHSGTIDNADNVKMTQIISLATLNGLAIGQLPSYVEAIADRNQYNPVADWITSKPWDGVDRLQAVYNTLVERQGYPKELKQILMYRWLLSTDAAALKASGFRARGVLTLQGPQGIGKTSWIYALVPNSILREEVIKLDHHLDAGNKDSVITAASHWIVEIGELDSSFKKDIARLKGFLTSDHDKVRRPYGKADSEYPRRTVFCATVNENNFLVDTTGNSRWWTIPVVKVNYMHGIDMQQVFAQLAVDLEKGAQWWLTPEEEKLLEQQNKDHRAISVTRERVLESIDLEKASDQSLPAMTPTQLLQEIGIANPSTTQAKECAAVLRELYGEPKRINGQNKWRVPLKKQGNFPSLDFPAASPRSQINDDDDDKY